MNSQSQSVSLEKVELTDIEPYGADSDMGERYSHFNLAHCDEAVSAPSSTSFAMGGNESYGVPLHVNNSSELRRDEEVSASSSTAFAIGGNESYGVPLHVNNSGKLKRDEAVSGPSSTSFVMGENESYGVPLHVNNSGKLKRNEAVSTPSSTAFAMGGNASYGVPLHVNNSSELEPAHCYEAVSAPPSTAPASVSQSTSTTPPPIQHPSPASFNNENSTIPNSSKCDDLGRNSRAVIVLFVLMLALLLSMVTACVAFAVEVSRLKSEVSSFQQPLIENLTQQLRQELLRSNQQLNSSIRMANQQLVQEYASRVFPLDSCAALPPSSPSGHYWVRTPTGSAVLVYCDPTRSCGGVTGGWRRVAELDMTNSSQQCPSALRQRNDNNIRTCGTDPNRDCSSLSFPTDSLSYSKVCGKVRAYQVGAPDSFGSDRLNDLDTNYLDGVSLTHGTPRQHIWSFAAALDEVGTHASGNCPCINRDQASLATRPPAFVGNDYFCDTGSIGRFDLRTFYSGKPLWDGAGCGPLNNCCSFNNPPWFYKQLPQPTTDSIEMRVCRDEGTNDEDIAIELIEIYVQ